MKLKKYTGMLALALMVTVTGCSGAPGGDQGGVDGAAFDSVLAELEGLEGQARHDRLVELAQAEGQLNIYTSNSDTEQVMDVFADEYGIAVSVYRAGAESVLLRLLQENDAGFHAADFAEINARQLVVLDDLGLLQPYSGAVLDGFADVALYPGWTSHWSAVLTPVYNTNAVEAAEVPKTYAELAESEWAGRLAVESRSWEWYASLYRHFLEQGESEEAIDAVFEGIVSNASAQTGYLVIQQLVSTGEYDLSASGYAHLVLGQAPGTPVSIIEDFEDPGVLIQSGISMLRTAQNPATALLYYEWVLTEGLDIYSELGRTPTVRELGSAEGFDPSFLLLPVDADLILNEGDEWQTRWEQLLQALG